MCACAAHGYLPAADPALADKRSELELAHTSTATGAPPKPLAHSSVLTSAAGKCGAATMPLTCLLGVLAFNIEALRTALTRDQVIRMKLSATVT